MVAGEMSPKDPASACELTALLVPAMYGSKVPTPSAGSESFISASDSWLTLPIIKTKFLGNLSLNKTMSNGHQWP